MTHPETAARARQVPLVSPAQEALGLVAQIEGAGLNEAAGQAQGHRGVVGPLPGLQAEASAPTHAGHSRQGVTWGELHRSPERVTKRQAEQGANKPVTVHLRRSLVRAGLLP